MSEKSNLLLQDRIEQLRLQILTFHDPQSLAIKAGCQLKEGDSGKYIEIVFFDEKIELSYPELVARNSLEKTELSISIQALICYYILTADGNPIDNRWISYTELPGGLFYERAYQSYTGDKIIDHFGNKINCFIKANNSLEGEPLSIGNAGYRYWAFPRVPMIIIYNLGDDEFQSTCKILFDASAQHYLPTDACAILGSMLTHRIIQNRTFKVNS